MKFLIGALLTTVALAATASAQNSSAAPPGRRQDDERHTRATWTEGWKKLQVESRGRVELTDDERDVKSVSPGGFFEISSRGWWSLFGQRYVVVGNTDGTITRRFTLGAAERPVDADARAWIGDSIQRLARTGFDAEGRVTRILEKDGTAAVLDAISLAGSDYVKGRYFRLLFDQAMLDRPSAERVFRQSGREIGSDYELARVLIAAVDVIQIDEGLVAAFVEAADAVAADHEHARVLLAVLAKQPTPAAVRAVLDSSSRIAGDFEKSRVLLQVIAARPMDEATRQVLLEKAKDFVGPRTWPGVVSHVAQRQPQPPLIFRTIDVVE